MRKIKILTIALSTLFSIALLPALASAQAQQTGGKIAVIDVAFIFKNAKTIKTEVSQIENQMKAYEASMATTRKTMQKEAELLKTYKQGTPEYASQEEKLAGMESKVKLDTIRKRKELADAEARIYFTNYQKIKNVVKQVAEYNGIDLVLRYNSEEMDLAKQDSVLRGVMKGVVYRSPKLDLTNMVLQAMGGAAEATPQVAGAAGAQPATR